MPFWRLLNKESEVSPVQTTKKIKRSLYLDIAI